MASLSSKLDLLRGLVSGEQAFAGPRWLNLDVTRRCNSTCLGCQFHCAQGRPATPGDQQVKDVSPALVRRICDQLPAAGTRELTLAGEGEPLLHARLFDFLGDFARAGLAVELFTNGTLLDDERIEALLDAPPARLNVTFWAIDQREHARWHPATPVEHLARRIDGVRRLNAAKRRRRLASPRLNLVFPLTRSNRARIGERVALACRLGCDAVSFGFFRDWSGAYANLGLLPEEVHSLREDLRRAARALVSAGVAHNVRHYLAHGRWGPRSWTHVPCYASWLQCDIKVDGTVLPCCRCSTPMGNLLDEDFDGIWNGPRYRRFRRTAASLEGLATLAGGSCDCANCALVKDNLRVHQVFRFVAPWARRLRRPRAWAPVSEGGGGGGTRG